MTKKNTPQKSSIEKVRTSRLVWAEATTRCSIDCSRQHIFFLFRIRSRRSRWDKGEACVFMVAPRQTSLRSQERGIFLGLANGFFHVTQLFKKNFKFSTLSCRGKPTATRAKKKTQSSLRGYWDFTSQAFLPVSFSFYSLLSMIFFYSSNILPDTFCSQTRSFPSLNGSVSHSSGWDQLKSIH